MKIQKFNEILKYTDNVKNQIIKYGWNDKGRIRYHVAEPDDTNPQNISTFSTLEKAIDYLDRMGWDEDYKKKCIFQSAIRAVSQEEIDVVQTKMKYNL